MRITIIGLGFIAVSDALALARHHEVVLTGPLPDRVDAINARQFALADPALPGYLADWPLNLRATVDTAEALEGAGMVMISTPFPLDSKTRHNRTSELDSRIDFAHARCPGVPIVIRSAVPIGYTEGVRARLQSPAVICAPEFLREGQSLLDTLMPSQIVVGDRGAVGEKVAAVLVSATLTGDAPVRRIGASEAEAVKHFSQAYLAARVAYFNELDSYALTHSLNARQVIDGVCLDPRIGTGANNPCFGFGGQRLPRSTGHLTEAFGALPTRVLPRLAQANEARMALLTAKVMERGAARVGIYQPDTGENPGQHDALAELGERVAGMGANVITYRGPQSGAALEQFKHDCDLVITGRMAAALGDIRAKIFCRDLYAV